ncbi:RNA-directed DNA polymerase-like protein [Cucumis melo var. makuwa]|uniref:RNA-directed DNA polymerase-like protein n=1 Tax=Cucumis melo var. makuwa TaxID=1194695 RepID=A0A5D3CYD2_CUCMM|nr:RNA-directed DNA polymerase-like protein [Cucumis melo var. makuwa]
MVDSGATHNFIMEAEAKRLNLHWEKDAGRMKANGVSTRTSGDPNVFGQMLGDHWIYPFCCTDRPSPARWVENDFGHAIKEGSLARRTNIYGHPTQFVRELKEILCVLEKYRDVMPDSLPTKNAYRMAPLELAELRKQLDELLNAGFIRLAKAPYGTQFFSRRRMGVYDCAPIIVP